MPLVRLSLLLLIFFGASSIMAQTSADIAAAAKIYGVLPLAQGVRLSLWGLPDQFQDQIVSLLPHDPNKVLVYGRSMRSNLATIDVETGVAAPFDLDFDGMGWMSDADGVLRLSEKPDYQGYRFYFRPTAGDKWEEVPNLHNTETESIWQLAFSPSERTVAYLAFHHEDRTVDIRAVDLHEGRAKEVIAAKPGEAAEGIVYKGDLIGYDFGDGVPVYLDEQIKKTHAIVKKALPGHWVGFVDRSDDGQRHLFKAYAAGEGESYWLLDLHTQPAQLRPLFQAYDDLAPEAIAPVKAIHYAARDGLDIPGLNGAARCRTISPTAPAG